MGSAYRKRAPAVSSGRQRFRLQTLFVGRHRRELRLEQRERLQRAKVARRFHEHLAARIDQHLGDQVERLL
ncbi:hypothetical protein ACTMU2_27755 [Cupriavidus basilensis]